jgi:hypothetical protein
LVVGDENVVDVEIADEVEDEDFFDDVLLVEVLLVEVSDFVEAIDEEALLFDKDALAVDCEVDKGLILVSAADLFGALDLADVGTHKK